MSKTLEVAGRIMQSAQRDLWALADAVLHDVPAEQSGARTDLGTSTYEGRSVPDRINGLAAELSAHEITKADGMPYQPSYLGELRKAAMSWPKSDRQAEASFEAHRENTGEARPIFLALCAHARGESVRRPTVVEPEAWKDALAKLATRKPGAFKVQTQAVRIAMKKASKNTPTKLDGATFAELLGHLTVGIEGLSAFHARLAEFDLEDDDRGRMVKVLRLLADKCALTLTMLSADMSDEALAEFMDSAQ